MWESVKSPIGTRKNVKVINETVYDGVKVQVLEYEKLLAPPTSSCAFNLHFMEAENMRVRQLAIFLENDKIQLQAGAMSYFQGNVEMTSGVTMGNAIGRMFAGKVTGEAMAKPEYKGTGLVVSEPSFRHFLIFTLSEGEEVIVDKGMFYMATGAVKVEPVMQDNVSSAVLGGEGLFQLKMTGPGMVVCESLVPMDEVDVIDMVNDTLRVDGNFAILRTGNIRFTVERSAKTLTGSAMSGEGLVNVYRGTGQIWLAPTLKIYPLIG
jgi:uncharacterized protein (AIM24 family)